MAQSSPETAKRHAEGVGLDGDAQRQAHRVEAVSADLIQHCPTGRVPSFTLNASESFVKQMLDFQAQTTAWAKETPMGPIFESQYSCGQGLVDFWAGVARALWRIEEPKPEN